MPDAITGVPASAPPPADGPLAPSVLPDGAIDAPASGADTITTGSSLQGDIGKLASMLASITNQVTALQQKLTSGEIGAMPTSKLDPQLEKEYAAKGIVIHHGERDAEVRAVTGTHAVNALLKEANAIEKQLHRLQTEAHTHERSARTAPQGHHRIERHAVSGSGTIL